MTSTASFRSTPMDGCFGPKASQNEAMGSITHFWDPEKLPAGGWE